MSIIRDGDDTMTRYDLGGEVVAIARRYADGGWVIYTANAPGHSAPVSDADEARRVLASWDAQEAALADLRRAAVSWAQARERLDEKILDADAAGVPQTRIAEASGFSRQWVRHLLARPAG